MSKNTEDKPLKGKQKKIAESKAKDKPKNEKPTASGILNLNCCCTCKYFPSKIKHETQPCKVSGKYVARKAKMPCYKCKFN